MVKKRVRDADLPLDERLVKDDGSDTDDEMAFVDVEFEWFNFKPDVDFHGVKSLVRQLLDVDSQLFDLSALADLVLSQPTIGSTVKVDGEETDAYAFLTILNLRQHRKKKVIKDLTEYLIQKADSSPSLSGLSTILKSSSQVGLILAERLINVPLEISPPMYSMLVDEIEAAVEDEEPYKFTHYLILSKVYHEIPSTLDQEDAPRQKKSKTAKTNDDVFFFHPEDEVLRMYVSMMGYFKYTKDEGEGMADSKRAFQEMGIKPQGLILLIEADQFESAVKAVDECVGTQANNIIR